MHTHAEIEERDLRRALESSGQRFTEQRAAVFRFLAATDSHPSADEVFLAVRCELPGISLATVYKSLETLVGCGLAVKLTYSDGSARYDGRTDPHHHARCVRCGRVVDISGHLPDGEFESLRDHAHGFTVTGYRLELSGYCPDCVPKGSPAA
jgi:Fur family transcriptional regulator, peroxide stress response regulator